MKRFFKILSKFLVCVWLFFSCMNAQAFMTFDEWEVMMKDSSISPSLDCSRASFHREVFLICYYDWYYLPAVDNLFSSYHKYIMNNVDESDKKRVQDIACNMITEREKCQYYKGSSGKLYDYDKIMQCTVERYSDGINNLMKFVLSDQNGRYNKFYKRLFGSYTHDVSASWGPKDLYDLYKLDLVDKNGASKLSKKP